MTVLAFDAAGGSVAGSGLPGPRPVLHGASVSCLSSADTASMTPALLGSWTPGPAEDRWRTEHANPAVDDAHPFGGSFFEVQASPDGQILVGLVPAEAPYRD